MTTTTDYHKAVADVAKQAVACGVPPDFRRMWFDAESDLDQLRTATDAELTRLRRIETAACEALASGQARYTHLTDDGEYAGDLIPAAKMIALAEAVHGATVVDEKPPAASDEYARELDLALFAPMAAQDVAVDLDDDDGCPVGDPDCDLPADSLHEFCEAAGNEERAE